VLQQARAEKQEEWVVKLMGVVQHGEISLVFADPPPRAPANGRPGFPFGFLGAGGRLPKARRGRVYVQFIIMITIPCFHAGRPAWET